MWAALYLQLKGYRILKRRYKTPFGEIDLVAQRGYVLIAVEVKNRPTYGDALVAVTPRQQKRILSALQAFMMHHPNSTRFDCRFDIVWCHGFKIKHLKNAWS